MELGTIHEEAALCRAAWVGRPIGTIAIHCHHEMEIEPLTETAENRITYILQIKPESEQALRLRLFRPSIIPAKLDAARAKWDAARAERGLPHSAFCTTPDCPWDGKTIFPKAKG